MSEYLLKNVTEIVVALQNLQPTEVLEFLQAEINDYNPVSKKLSELRAKFLELPYWGRANVLFEVADLARDIVATRAKINVLLAREQDRADESSQIDEKAGRD